jgi:ADP-ribose pyrophosphatase YjhB (NUDIX family)
MVRAALPCFCEACGGPLAQRFVESENRARIVCARCGLIAYRNPTVLVTTIVASGDRVLLCRRSDPPMEGRWSLPGGYVECGESLEEAAARETLEETGIRLNPRELRLHALSTLPEISEVYVGFLAHAPDDAEPTSGPECTQVGFFAEAAVPWGEFTYSDVALYLRLYFREQHSGDHAIHFSRLDARGVLRSAYHISSIEDVHRSRG